MITYTIYVLVNACEYIRLYKNNNSGLIAKPAKDLRNAFSGRHDNLGENLPTNIFSETSNN